MRIMLSLFAVALLSLSVSGCMETDTNAANLDPSFRCPSGDCQGANSAGNMGGNHPF